MRPAKNSPVGTDTRSLLVRALERAAAFTNELEATPLLKAVEQFFTDRLDDNDACAAIQASRERAEALASPAGRPSNTLVLAFAGEAFDLCALDCGWRASEAEELVRELARLLREPPAEISGALFLSASRSPHLLELPPRIALQIQLGLIAAFAPTDAVSLWRMGPNGRPECLGQVGTPTRTMRLVAKRVLEGADEETARRQTIDGVPVTRWGRPWAALVARRRADDRVTVEGFLSAAAAAISPLVERDMLLERSSARERALVDAAEKRLLRLGLDLHDGPLQELAALADDLRFARRRLVPLVPPHARELADGRYEDADARLLSIDRNLRELAHSLESSSITLGPMQRVLEREVGAFGNETGIEVRLKLRGEFEPMTRSQKLALFRIIQEGLSNVREHSCATEVDVDVVARVDRIEARIADNGTGFDVSDTLFDAARRGRLGLVGMGERARLLAGKLDVQSCPGGPTVIVLTLPRAFAAIADTQVDAPSAV